jgi:two-component system, OmpR family, sensor kinase
MSRIVDELLFLSRADMGEVKVESMPVALQALVEDVHRQAKLLGYERQIEVVLGTVMPVTVKGDDLRLRELLLNLVENAMKYSNPGGKVEISLLRDGQEARLSITDHGIGIAAADHKKIFQRFYRTDVARAHTKKGTGLGLAICAWIADLHKGRVEVKSELGQGSTFTVVLPLMMIPA